MKTAVKTIRHKSTISANQTSGRLTTEAVKRPSSPNRPSKNMPVRYISMRNMQRYWSEKEKTRSVSQLMRLIKGSTKGIQVMIRQMHRSRQLPVSSITYTHIHWKVRFILLPYRSTTVLKIRSITFIYASATTEEKSIAAVTGSME